MKNQLVGKLAAKTSSIYGETLEHIESDPAVIPLFPKVYYTSAVISMDDAIN